jgi:hypothetical protein
MKVHVAGYRRSDLAVASGDYLQIEKKIAGTRSDAELVSADSMDSLRRAYSNYFLDTHRLLKAVNQAVS